MKILQLLPTFAYGDAVGNDALTIYRILAGKGYDTAICAENIDPKAADAAIPISSFPTLGADDILIYHFSIKCSETMRRLLHRTR